MANHQSQYKINNNFGNIKNNRAKRAIISELKRKEQRIEDFSIKRELEIIPIEETEDLKDCRYRKLLKWRAERDRLKKMEQTKKKPAFKVGVVHHNYYSSPIKVSNVLSPIKLSINSQKQVTQPTLPFKRITRATEKCFLRKQEKLTTEVPRKQNVTEKKQEKSEGKNKRKNNVKTEQKSFAPDNFICYKKGQVLKYLISLTFRDILKKSKNYSHLFCIGGVDGKINIWELLEGKNDNEIENPKYEFKISNDSVNGVNVHKSFPIVATSSGQRIYDIEGVNRDNSVRLWWFN